MARPKGLAQILTPWVNNANDACIGKQVVNIGMLLPHETETGEQDSLHTVTCNKKVLLRQGLVLKKIRQCYRERMSQGV